MHDFLFEVFHFRNESHFYWFIISMSLLLTYIVIKKFITIKNEADEFGIVAICAGFHTLTAAYAFVKVFIQKEPSYAFSIDCVWFNPLMIIIYLIVYKFVNQKK